MARDFTLKYDAAVIAQAAHELNRYADEIYTIQAELVAAFKNLKHRDWRGKTADMLDGIIGTEWSKNVQRYCDLMKLLTDIMNTAAGYYDAIEHQAQQLRLNE